MKRNAVITKGVSEIPAQEPDVIGEKGEEIFYGSPFGTVTVTKGATVREAPADGREPVVMRSKRKYRG